LRLALSAAGVAGAIVRGVRPSVAFVTWVFGAVVCGFAVISTRQGMAHRASKPWTDPAWRVALRATYPSTIGLTALTVFGLALEPQVGALTAGLLAGLGFAALAVAAQLEWWRRATSGDEPESER
jgi:hypothetical protein